MTPSPCVPLPAGKGEEKKEVLAHLLRTPFEKWIQKEAPSSASFHLSLYLIPILKQVKPSTISTAKLNTLLYLHTPPIKLVVY
jgi:hypothetical protein